MGRFFRRGTVLFLFFVLAGAVTFSFRGGKIPPAPPEIPVRRRALLIPLDSRPPCGRFAADAGSTAGVEVTLPPPELLDSPPKIGDTEKLMAWTAENLPFADEAIISVDQLLHGGLLASRQANKTKADEKRLVSFLRKLHADNPTKPLFAFSILPRMAPPDGMGDFEEQRRLMAYSGLVGKIAKKTRPSDSDLAALRALRESISPEGLSRYEGLFAGYADFASELIALAEEGTLQGLVIGQDDSEPTSIPGRVFAQLSEGAGKKALPRRRVFFTHGADEIALAILAAREAALNSLTKESIQQFLQEILAADNFAEIVMKPANTAESE